MKKEEIFNSIDLFITIDDFYLRKLKNSDRTSFVNLFDEADINYYHTRDDIYQNDIKRMFDDIIESSNMFYCLFMGIFKNEKLIGFCEASFHKDTEAYADLSFSLSAKYRGHGIMTKSLKQIIEIIEVLDFSYIHAVVDSKNKGSQAVMKSIGFLDTRFIAAGQNLDEYSIDRIMNIWKKHLTTEKMLMLNGASEFRAGNYQNVISLFTKIINRSNNALAYYNRATAYFMLKNDRQALSDYRMAKELGFSNLELEHNILKIMGRLAGVSFS